MLFSIPWSYAINNLALVILALTALITSKKESINHYCLDNFQTLNRCHERDVASMKCLDLLKGNVELLMEDIC